MRIAVTGATGLIGSALVAHLRARGDDVVRISRQAKDADVTWSPSEGRLDPTALDGVDAVVHLAGAGIADHRWTDDYKRAIRDSRLDGTALLARTIAGMAHPPAVLLSGSAIGIYGSRGDEVLDETSAPGTGFLSDVCVAWEAATAPAADAGVRVAHLRTGIVLSGAGGALRKQLPLFKFGLGGKMGSGRQWQSWISIDDEVGAIVHLLSSAVSGPVNLTAPNPVTNAEFTDTLGTALHRPTVLPIPKFGPQLLLGAEAADNLLFTGQRVLPKVLLADGYQFRHPDLADALQAAIA
jgi:uncharacterized protein